MQSTEQALDLWHPQAVSAYRQFQEITLPSWRRKLTAENTPAYPQAKFEYDAILKEARRLYHAELLRCAS